LLVFVIHSAFSLFANPVSAEQSARFLEEIVVTASKIEETIEESPSSITVITRSDIEAMNVQFVPDVLRSVPELNVRQTGGTGKLATVRIRGGSPRHVVVMIDGVKVKSTTTGDFDFSGVSVDDIERIEIIKGPQSIMYGSEAMAGVINIITKKGKDMPRLDALFKAGSFGTYSPSITFSGGAEKFDYRITGDYFRTDGISAAKQGTERDGYKNASISGKFGFRPTERLDLGFTVRYSYNHSELDFGTTRDDPNYIQRGSSLLLSGRAKFYLLDAWEQILTVSTVKDSLKTRDPDDIFGWHSSDITTGIDTIDWQHNLYFSNTYTLTGGIEYRREKGESIALPQGARQGIRILRFDKSIDNNAVYLNNKLSFFDNALILNAGLRHDEHKTFGGKTTYRIGAVYNIMPAAMRIRGNYGTGFTAPTLNQLFWPDVGWFKGNPDLKPEESSSWEIGIDKEILKDKISLSVTYFDQEYKNLIAGWYPPRNIAKAQVKGIEADTALKVSDAVNIKVGYAYLDSKDKETGKKLPRSPKDKVSISTDYRKNNLMLNAQYIYIGKRYDRDRERDELGAYSLVNLSASYRVSKGITLFGRVHNLFDEKYEEARGFGTYGLSVFGGLRVSL
jgi:vitamin B12 transporter